MQTTVPAAATQPPSHWVNNLVGIHLQVLPPRAAQLAGSNEEKWCEFKCVLGWHVASVAVDSPEKFANSTRLGYRRKVSRGNRHKRTSKVSANVAVRAPRRDRVSRHATEQRPNPMRSLMRPSRLNPSQHREQIRLLDLGHRHIPERRIQHVRQTSVGDLVRIWRERLLLNREPLITNRTQRIRARKLLCFSLRARINTISEKPARVITFSRARFNGMSR